jgi:hypothetical protein
MTPPDPPRPDDAPGPADPPAPDNEPGATGPPEPPSRAPVPAGSPERPTSPPARAPRPAASPPTSPVVAPPWAARAVLGVAVVAGGALVGRPAGLGLVAVLFALGLIGGVGVAHGRTLVAPVLDLRLAGSAAGPGGRDWWRAAWWALAGALACLPVLRAAGWVVVPAVATAAALGSLAVTGGARWSELLAGLRAAAARMPAGLLLAGRASAAGTSFRGAAPAARLSPVRCWPCSCRCC